MVHTKNDKTPTPHQCQEVLDELSKQYENYPLEQTTEGRVSRIETTLSALNSLEKPNIYINGRQVTGPINARLAEQVLNQPDVRIHCSAQTPEGEKEHGVLNARGTPAKDHEEHMLAQQTEQDIEDLKKIRRTEVDLSLKLGEWRSSHISSGTLLPPGVNSDFDAELESLKESGWPAQGYQNGDLERLLSKMEAHDPIVVTPRLQAIAEAIPSEFVSANLIVNTVKAYVSMMEGTSRHQGWGAYYNSVVGTLVDKNRELVPEVKQEIQELKQEHIRRGSSDEIIEVLSSPEEQGL